MANVTNWGGINGITSIFLGNADGVNSFAHLAFAQDYFQNNKGLTSIQIAGSGYYNSGVRDSTFKLSRLKTGWNTYFTGLQVLKINDGQWSREDLSGLTQLNLLFLVADNQLHSNNTTSNPVLPIPSSAIDSVLNQVSAGAGQTVSNGFISILPGGASRTSASNAAVSQLKSKGWTIYIEGVLQ
jgi:hypothetical protein